jgi:hypothetical protein
VKLCVKTCFSINLPNVDNQVLNKGNQVLFVGHGYPDISTFGRTGKVSSERGRERNTDAKQCYKGRETPHLLNSAGEM